jgi:hypothetical protein
MPMQALDLDLLAGRRPVSALGVVLLLAGLVALAMVAFDYFDARGELQRVQSRQLRGRPAALPDDGARRRDPPAVAAAPRLGVRDIGRIDAQLRLPWDQLLHELALHADANVALLSIEVQADRRTLRMTGEARSMDDVAAYVGRLRTSRWITVATIASHEERLAGAVKVLRFSLDAGWSEPS